ncbi:unnamed protein product [Cuscuta europaea]|uniref:Fe2OG dioxygenase domain-containing protein n=1 Tax=Cuscuta europaea TaxID=41803 RepID=A0A9P0ZTA3_CUSEU|nr:unnamed protein product [Cuscuta europaea]
MLVLSQPVLGNYSHTKACKSPTAGIPVVDLLDPEAKHKIVSASKEFGFFKLVNHGVPYEAMVAKLEAEAQKFFNLPQHEKDRAGPPNPFGYGNKNIGPNGDIGWVEYLLFTTNPELISHTSISSPASSQPLRGLVNEYVGAVKNVSCEVLEKMAEGLKIRKKNVFSRLIKDDKSDSCFRVNHYPPYSDLQELSGNGVIGFGEHTDPQVISVVRSNNTTGLQICLKDGSWASVPPDPHSLFILVGDSLQVLTNGRFRSVKHRVLTNSAKPRLSMIYFGGPPLKEKIAALSCLMEEGEESLYHEFTWTDYKKSAYMTKLAANRLSLFEKNNPPPPTAQWSNPSSSKYV